MTLSMTTGAMLYDTMWRTESITDNRHLTTIKLPIVANPQPIAFQQNDGKANHGWKLSEFSANISVTEDTSPQHLAIGITLNTTNATATLSGSVEPADGCIVADSTDENGHNNGAPFKVSGLSSTERPRFNNHVFNGRIEAVAGEYGAINSVSIAYSPDESEDLNALKYEVGACHPQVITTGYAGWTPFGTGESCSTYEMAVLLAHNTNRVNYCTVPRHSILVRVRGIPYS